MFQVAPANEYCWTVRNPATATDMGSFATIAEVESYIEYLALSPVELVHSTSNQREYRKISQMNNPNHMGYLACYGFRSNPVQPVRF